MLYPLRVAGMDGKSRKSEVDSLASHKLQLFCFT